MTETAGYTVRLEHYYGPLDLLLHLVQANEVDIIKIPLSTIADQYLQFIQMLQKHDLEMSGDFVALAAHLLLLKGRAVAPPDAETLDEEAAEQEEEAPLLELIRKLLEFRKVKDLSARVGELMDARRGRWGRPRPKVEAPPVETIDRLELWDLVVAYAQLVERTTLKPSMEILYRDVPIERFVERILLLLTQRSEVKFTQVLGAERADRGAVVGSFMAILELMKQQKITADQDEGGGDINIRPRTG